jgi:hypothetical protein
LWLLDGDTITAPDEPETHGYGYSGYISDLLSDSDGFYSTNPVIKILFDELVTSALPGLTIKWSTAHDDFPTAFKITLYENGVEHTVKTVTHNRSVKSVTKFTMSYYDRIDIEVIRWSRPFRRARIERIYFGIPNTDNANLLRLNWIDGGVYYLSDWNATQNGLSASFKARDLLGFMHAPYYKGVYEPNGVNLYDLAERVLHEACLPVDTDGSDLWVLDDVLRDYSTQSPLPVCSMAECLQLIANAACCAIFFDKRGRIHIEPFGRSEDEICIDDDHSYSKAEISLSAPIRQFDVSRYSYIDEEEKTLYSGVLTLNSGRNEFILEYSDIAKDAAADLTINGSGVTVVSRKCYAKCCILILESATSEATCDVTVTGTVIKPLETVIVIPHLETGETQALKNTLITNDAHAQTAGAWLKANLTRRNNFSFDWRVDPRVEPGDIANVQNGTTTNRMRITSCGFSFNGAFKGRCEGVEME